MDANALFHDLDHGDRETRRRAAQDFADYFRGGHWRPESFASVVQGLIDRAGAEADPVILEQLVYDIVESGGRCAHKPRLEPLMQRLEREVDANSRAYLDLLYLSNNPTYHDALRRYAATHFDADVRAHASSLVALVDKRRKP